MAKSKIHDQSQTQRGRRRSERRPLDGPVVVWFDDTPLVGSGQNVSEDGVFFVADGGVKVRVQIEGKEQVVGEVVRVTSMGHGKTGIAVAFQKTDSSDLTPES